MSGTISFSLSQQFDSQGKPLSGGLFYTFVAGTTSTPQNAYQDGALTIPYPNPIVLDAAGRIPQFFLADGLIKIRLTDHTGVVQIVADNIMVIGPSGGGGGGGGTIDATTIYQTGDMKPRYGTGFHTGWVRANGGAIGSATSTGATGLVERANADCQALFEYLWGADTTLAVSGSRGLNAHADWLANKQLSLPDLRGRVLAGVDDMGNTASLRLTTAGGMSSAFLGAVGGLQTETIAQNQLPNVVPTFTGTQGTVNSSTTANNILLGTLAGPMAAQTGSGTGVLTGTGFSSATALSAALFTPAGTISSINGNVGQAALITVQPTIVATYYIKL